MTNILIISHSFICVGKYYIEYSKNHDTSSEFKSVITIYGFKMFKNQDV